MKKILIYLFFFLNLFIILFLWWQTSGNLLSNNGGIETNFIVLGRIAGLLAVYFILLQFLVIGRVKWIEKNFGFDRLSVVHHWLGIVSIFTIIVHLVFLAMGYSILYGVSAWQQFIDFNIKWDDLFSATIATIFFIITAIISIAIVKKKLKYEFWYYVHLITYVAILMAFGHQLELGYDLRTSTLFSGYWILLYLFVGVNFVFCRFIWQIVLFKKHQFFVSEVQAETGDTTSIYISGKDLKNFKYKPGQFLILRFLNKRLIWQSHPYSISSLPNDEYVRITIKNLGDFSGKTKKIPIGTKVIIDGPNGIFTKRKKQGEKFLFIAGGVGITPIRALLEDFLQSGKDVVLLYSVRKKEQIIFKDDLERLLREKTDNFKLYYIISEEESPHGFRRIDKECIECLVSDVGSREVYLCGPPAMSKAMKKHLIKLKVNKHKIYYEKFSF